MPSLESNDSPDSADDHVPDRTESATTADTTDTPQSAPSVDAADSIDSTEPTSSADNTDPADSTEAADSTDSADTTETADISDQSADPRLDEEYVRTVAHPDGKVTLVGVVHDHPASVYRAREVVCERDPEFVALEAPPLATPLYSAYAQDSRTPPSFGGEMSAAAQAGQECDAEVVGIDGPTTDFFGRLARNCWREDSSAGTLRRVASGVASVTRHALVCRAAATVASRTSLRVEVDDPVEHDCGWADPPSVQADDERAQARRSQSLLRTFDPPRPVALRDQTREEHMAERLESLRGRGETVAIVGLDHLDRLAERITG